MKIKCILAGIVFLLSVLLSLYGGYAKEKVIEKPTEKAGGKTVERISDANLTLMKSLQDREMAISVKEKALVEKEKELLSLQKEVEEKMAKNFVLQAEVEGKLGELNAAKDKRFKNLVTIYSEMSPSKVAPLLSEMDINVASEILRTMKPEQVAKIMPKLSPEKAVAISKDMGILTSSK